MTSGGYVADPQRSLHRHSPFFACINLPLPFRYPLYLCACCATLSAALACAIAPGIQDGGCLYLAYEPMAPHLWLLAPFHHRAAPHSPTAVLLRCTHCPLLPFPCLRNFMRAHTPLQPPPHTAPLWTWDIALLCGGHGGGWPPRQPPLDIQGQANCTVRQKKTHRRMRQMPLNSCSSVVPAGFGHYRDHPPGPVLPGRIKQSCSSNWCGHSGSLTRH